MSAKKRNAEGIVDNVTLANRQAYIAGGFPTELFLDQEALVGPDDYFVQAGTDIDSRPLKSGEVKVIAIYKLEKIVTVGAPHYTVTDDGGIHAFSERFKE